ncbi:IclR family transcriptional regulator [Thioclava nitratireducens]|uniref:IclR family transcriptional regulator n=1 Tax=Thioclava nitratireducens TaxID=1915078 RepID=UPI0024817024|nr:helix-turn-helix domain-containing protein [Thioclava nitratireducens]WGT50451.1 helix-turn-helix domain-containing protein [Thioclava nitratireducens]
MDDRSLTLLEAVAHLAEGATARAIATHTGLPQATAYRRLGELETLGVLELFGRSYRLGPRLYRLLASGLPHETLKQQLAPAASRIAEATGEVCFAGRLVDTRIEIFLTQKPNTVKGPMVVPPHGLRPVTVCSAAKAILAFVPKGLRDDVVRQNRAALPEAPQRPLPDFEADLATVRATGVAHCIGDEDPDCASIAVPLKVFGGYGQLCLGLSGTRNRIQSKLDQTLTRDFQVEANALDVTELLNVA